MITKDTTARHFEHTVLTNADGTPQRWRRNGRTQTWKTRPESFRIPIKRGLKEYGEINELNAGNYREAG